MSTETIWLQRPSGDVPWGFRLQGGRDLQQPLTVQRVSAGSIASTGLNVGDEVLSIGDIDTTHLTHAQAQQIVKTSGNLLQLHISKTSPVSPGYSKPPQWSTKLDEQIASMNLNDGSPYSGGSGGPYSPTTGHRPEFPSSPYNRQISYGSTHSNSSGPPGAPEASSPMSGPTSPGSYGHSQNPQTQAAMPDAVLNMAAKGPPEKKPWSYAPDMSTLKEQREKVRRRTPSSSLPKYQNILNLPSFDDAPPHVVPKKGSSVPSTPSGGDIVGDPLASVPADGGFVKHAQFNSPLQLYSDENAADALETQSGGMVTAFKRQTSSGAGKDITQSATYRMIHGLDDAPKPKFHPIYGEGKAPKPVRQPSHDDEVKFSGVNRPSDIPSKSFRHLQNMTVRGAQGEVDDTPIRANVSGDDPDDIGGYDEASIRYLGRKIPSKSFQLLQSMTGGPIAEDMTPKRTGPRRTPQRSTPQRSTPQRSTPQREAKQNPDDGVEISYVGPNIPSKSFQYLQQSISQPARTPSAASSVNTTMSIRPAILSNVPASPSAPTPPHTTGNQPTGPGRGRNVRVVHIRRTPSREGGGISDL